MSLLLIIYASITNINCWQRQIRLRVEIFVQSVQVNNLTFVNNKKFFCWLVFMIGNLWWEKKFIGSTISIHLRVSLRPQLSQKIDALFFISIECKRNDIVVMIVNIFSKLHRWSLKFKINMLVFVGFIVVLLNCVKLPVT